MNNVRLTEVQLQAIKELFRRHFLKQDHLWLFGSRADLSKKGGDIDFYIETSVPDLADVADKKIAFLVDLKLRIGDQKIDLVVNALKYSKHLPIYDEAKETGVLIV